MTTPTRYAHLSVQDIEASEIRAGGKGCQAWHSKCRLDYPVPRIRDRQDVELRRSAASEENAGGAPGAR